MDVDPGEPEVAIRQLGEPSRARRPGSSSRREHPRAARGDRREARPQGDSKSTKVGAWERRPPRSHGSAGLSRVSRTKRCSAARAASSTISTRSRTPGTPPCCARRSRTRASRASTRPARSSSRASSACSRAPMSQSSRGPSRPAIDSPIPHYAAAHELARYVGEPVAVVVARDRYLAEDAARADRGRVRAARRPSSTRKRRRTDACVSDRSFHYGDVDGALAGADLVVRERFRFPRWSCTPVECYGVVADWNAAEGSLTAWANFQGPFTLHSVAAAALGLPGSKLRLITPPDSGGSLRDQVGGLRLRRPHGPRLAEARRPGALDRGPARAPRRELLVERTRDARRGRVHGPTASSSRSATTRSRTSARTCARPSRRRSTACTGRSPARTAFDTWRPGTASSSRTRCPSGLNRGFGGPQLYLALERTMTIAANRLGLDPAELRRRNLVAADAFPYRTPSGALYDSGDYEGCLDDALDARALRRASRGGRGRARRRTPRRSRDRLRRRAVDLEHGLHHARRAGRRPRGLPKSGNAEGCTIVDLRARRDHRPDGDDAAGTGPSHGDRAGRRRRARRRPDGRRRRHGGRHVHHAVDDRVRELLLPLLGRRRRRGRGGGRAARGEDRARSATTSATRARRSAGSPGPPTGIPSRCHPEMEPGLAVTAYYAAPNLLPPDDDDRVASSASHGFVADVAVVEVDRETGRGRGPRLRHGARRGAAAQPAARRRAGARWPRARGGVGALRAPRLRRGREPPHRLVHGLPRADRAGPPDAAHRAPRVAVAVPPARREGARRGDDDERARGRSRTPSPTRSDATTSSRRSRPVACGSCSSGEAGAVRVRAAGVARGGGRASSPRAATTRRCSQAARASCPRSTCGCCARRSSSTSTASRDSTTSTAENGALRVGATVRQADSRLLAHPALGGRAPPRRAHRHAQPRHRLRLDRARRRRRRAPARARRCDGSAVAVSARGRREIPADELFLGPFTTALAPDELLVETVWPTARRRRGVRVRRARPARRRLRALHGCRARSRRRAPRRRRLGHPGPDRARGRSGASGRVGRRAGRAVGLDPRHRPTTSATSSASSSIVWSRGRESRRRDRRRRHGQRPPPPRGGRAAPPSLRLPPAPPRPHRDARRLRARCLRRVHGAARRRGGALVPPPRGAGRRQRGRHGRGARGHRAADAAAGGVPPAPRAPVRVLHAGILIAADDLLSRERPPTREEIVDMLSGQLCRCTGYAPIVDAIAEVAGA